MIKHIVMWKLKNSENGKSKEENAAKIKLMLEDLNGKIPGLVKLEVGIDFSDIENSSDVILYSEFKSKEDLKAYQIHPEHEKVKPFVLSCRSERRLVDYVI
ncbi:MAG: Dabb family protein [Bacteroidales bacterium]|nr:Dabb family protein [Bacteroidales bacterium]